MDAYIAKIYEEYAVLGERKVAISEVDLITKDADGNRLVRKAETNLGNLCADAFRYVVDADIGYMNGGSIRADMLQGDVTVNSLLSVQPFNNSVVQAEISGQAFLDMMEMAMMIWPEENGSFPHVSGVTFSVNTAIPSSVVLNEYEEFVGVSGEYRVYDLKIYNRETGNYEPIDLNKTYTLAASNYILLECGSGMKMLENAKILQNDGMLDIEAMERYMVEELEGRIGEEYAQAKIHVTFTEGRVESETTAPTETTESDATTPDESATTPEEVTTEAENGGGCASILNGGILVCVAAISLAITVKKKQY